MFAAGARATQDELSAILPVVEGVTPFCGPTGGGIKLTIRGRNFGNDRYDVGGFAGANHDVPSIVFVFMACDDY